MVGLLVSRAADDLVLEQQEQEPDGHSQKRPAGDDRSGFHGRALDRWAADEPLWAVEHEVDDQTGDGQEDDAARINAVFMRAR
jgi:hypothetical protein